MTEGKYEKQANGSFVKVGDPSPLATTMEFESGWIELSAKEYSIQRSVGVARADLPERQRGIAQIGSMVTLTMAVETDRRSFFTIKEEGVAPVEDFVVTILANAGDEACGYVRHWPALENNDFELPEGLTGMVLLPKEELERLLHALEQPSYQLSLSLNLPFYKPNIARDFDRDWMAQEFYFPYDEQVMLNQASVKATLNVGVRAQGVSLEARANSAPATSAASAVHTIGLTDPRLITRLNVIIALGLAMLIYKMFV